MNELILAAIERAAPGLTEGDRRGARPSWVGKMLVAAEIWLGGLTITDIDVRVIRNDGIWGIEKVIISVTASDVVVAQTTIEIAPDRDDGEGRFTAWKLVHIKTIADLAWTRQRVGASDFDQLTATFRELPEPVMIPAEIESADPARFTRMFRLYRNAWIDPRREEPVSGTAPT